jgi:hypothetical protein
MLQAQKAEKAPLVDFYRCGEPLPAVLSCSPPRRMGWLQVAGASSGPVPGADTLLGGLAACRFQRREHRRSELMNLRTKFEADKKRVAGMKAARNFRPF